MNRPNPPQYSDFELTESYYKHIKSKIIKIEEYKNKASEFYYKILAITLFVIGIILLIFTLNRYDNFNWEFKPVFLLIVLTIIILNIIYRVLSGLFYKPFNKWAENLAKLRCSPVGINELNLVTKYDAALGNYRKALEEYDIQIKKYKEEQIRKAKNFWYSLSGWEFEKEFGKILMKNGFKTQITSGSADEGIDIFATKNSIEYAIQCKAHKNPCSPSIIRDLYGAMNHYKISNGMLVNLGGFTRGVHNFVIGKRIILLDIDDILQLHSEEKRLP